MSINYAKNRGFIALITVLMISGILLLLVTANSLDEATFFDEALHKEYRTLNYYNAYSCIDRAILSLAHDYFFLTDSEIKFPELNCSILSVSAQGNTRLITAVGTLGNSNVYRTAKVQLLDNSLQIISIQ